MPKPEAKSRTLTDPCAADHEIIGAGGILTLRVAFNPLTLTLVIPDPTGGSKDLVVTNQIVRYEFTETGVTLALAIEPPPGGRVEARQRSNSPNWGPLQPITVPNNDNCTPIDYVFWDATIPQPEPEPNTVPQMQIKARKHSPKTGTSKVKPHSQ